MVEQAASVAVAPSPEKAKSQWVADLVKAGFALTPLLTKDGVPTKDAYLPGWPNTPYNPELTSKDFPENYGVVLGDDDFVLDVDPRAFKPYENGDMCDSLAVLLGRLGLFEFQTYTVQSGGEGGKGVHIYFKKPPGFKIRNSHFEFPGIACYSKGRQLVGPGSIHPETGKMYIVRRGLPSTIENASTDLLDLFGKKEDVNGADDFWDDREATRALYADRLKNYFKPAIQGADGEPYTMQVIRAGRDLGLPPERTLELMMTHWNQKCVPPWNEDELSVKVNNAYRYAKKPVGNDNPSAGFPKVEVKPISEQEALQEQWRIDLNRAFSIDGGNPIHLDLRKNAKGHITGWSQTIANVEAMFQHQSYGSYTNILKDCVRYNALAHQIELTHRMPWHSKFRTDLSLSKSDITEMRMHINKSISGAIAGVGQHRFSPSYGEVEQVVSMLAERNAFHPVADKLNSLVWDGVPRISKTFPYYWGSADTRYNRTVGRIMFVAAAARILLERHDPPWCERDLYAKYDYLIILESGQGAVKTEFCNIMGYQKWAGTLTINFNKREEMLRSINPYWIVQIPEFKPKHNEIELLKDFLSAKQDPQRDLYAISYKTRPRQSIFIASMNPEKDNTYLPDQTGNRRYLPVKVRDLKVKEFQADLDQMYAEAVHLYRQGAPWYLDDERTQQDAAYEQKIRTISNDWSDVFAPVLAQHLNAGQTQVTLNWLMDNILKLPARDQTTARMAKVSSTMARLGWAKVKVPVGGALVNGFRYIDTSALSDEAKELLDEV